MVAALIQQLPVNKQGKDYVVGDLHGCYGLLERLLEEVKFDRTNDRLFSVGDLVDRGPDSLRCLELLAEPWFHAVMGNHEEMLLMFFLAYMDSGILESLDDINDTGFILNGGEWIGDYYLPAQKCLADEFNRGLVKVLDLPLILVVGEGDSRFHIVHAELAKPACNPNGQTAVWLDRDIDDWLASGTLPKQMYERLLWGRQLFYPSRYQYFFKLKDKQLGLATTFCGHTPTMAPRQVLSHVCVDTGAYYTLSPDITDLCYGLTLFDIKASCWFTASYLRDEIIQGDFTMKPA